jgi:hypothetical protein
MSYVILYPLGDYGIEGLMNLDRLWHVWTCPDLPTIMYQWVILKPIFIDQVFGAHIHNAVVLSYMMMFILDIPDEVFIPREST